MWIPAQTTVPPRSTAASATGTSAPTGAKSSAAPSGSGDGSSLPPAHAARQLPCECLTFAVAGTRECEHLPTLCSRDLRDQMRGGPGNRRYPLARVADGSIRTVADQAGA
jgi:hypothetical protein